MPFTINHYQGHMTKAKLFTDICTRHSCSAKTEAIEMGAQMLAGRAFHIVGASKAKL